MKKIITLSVMLLSIYAIGQKKEKVKGSRIVKLEQKEIASFKSIEVEDNLEVFLVKGKECTLEIEADDNLIQYVEYKSAGSNLRISTAKDLSSYKKLSVRVTYTDDFTMVVAKNETNVTALSDIVLDNITFKSYDYAKLFLNAKTKNFTLMANDKSRVELNLKSEKTAIDLSKSATLKALISYNEMKFDMYQKSSAELEGDIVDLKLRLDNNTDFVGRKLMVKNASLETNGYSKSVVNISNLVTINASDYSEIELYGDILKYDLKHFSDNAILRKKSVKK